MIEGPVSGRWAVVEAQTFLARFDSEGAELESYLLSLIEPLSDLVDALDPIGLTPGPFVRLADTLAGARAAREALRGLPPLWRAETALRRRAAQLYAYAGAVRDALQQLKRIEEASGEGSGAPVLSAVGEEQAGHVSPHGRFQELRRAVEDGGLKRELDGLAGQWAMTRPEQGGHGAWVPVVERLPSWAQENRQRPDRDRQTVGALRRVVVDLRGATRRSVVDARAQTENKDRLWTGGALHANTKDLVDAPLSAARAWIDREYPGLRGRYLEGRLAFDWSHLRREGQSAGLAIASLCFTAALEETGQRRRLVLRPEATFTGTVSDEPKSDPPGTTSTDVVRPVSEQGLAIKVQTAFYSPQDTLAVPAAQKAPAHRVLDQLLDRHPHGHLDIVGVSELRDVMDHRRLTERTETSWPRHAARRLWAHRGPAFAGTVIVVLVMALAALVYRPLDKTPVTADFEGEQMIVKNAGGAVIERISVGARVVRHVQRPNKHYTAYSFHDVTGDGQQDICWGQNTPDSEGGDYVACKEVGAEEPLWRFPLDSLAAPFPNKPAVRAGRYSPAGMVIRDLVGGDQPEVYVTTSHRPYFPSLFLQLDARTGEEMGRYVHAGHFKAGPVPVDLEDDGTEELLIGGYTNAYDQAAIAVLDPRRVAGHGPVTPEYAVSGHDRAAERAYIRFPQTKVGAVQGDGVSVVRRIRVREDGRIEVQVRDGHAGSVERGDEAYILVYFDRSLRPQAVGTSSHYDRLADTLAQRGALDSEPDAEYFEQYRGRLLYWTGEEWQAKNKR